MAELKIREEDNLYKVKSEGFYLEFPAEGVENQKALILFLRSFKKKENGKHGLFKQKQIAQALPAFNGTTQQSIRGHEKHFEESGKNIRRYLNHKRKVDEQIVEATSLELEKDTLANNRELAEKVNIRLARTDVTEANIDAALEQIPAKRLRKSTRKQMEKRSIGYKQEYLLEKSLSALLSRDSSLRLATQTLLERAGIKPEQEEIQSVTEVAQINIKNLLTVDGKLEDIPEKIKLMVTGLRLYGSGMALRGLGQLFGVDKTTVLRWIMAIAIAVYPILMSWIKERVKGGIIYLDEKWIKIKGRWHYWFVALDADTKLPIVSELMAGRTQWDCQWILVKLKQSYNAKVIVTDGLLGYLSAITAVFSDVIHQLCLFHHQQNVTKFAKQHFSSEQEREDKKREMKKMFQTSDKRTVISRFERLKAKAQEWGITQWVNTVTGQLPHLLPAVGSQRIPSTSNAVERFFRRFNQFYIHRNGFFSTTSAKDQLKLFSVFYLFTKAENGVAPLESIMPEISRTPFYKLMNDPLFCLGILGQQTNHNQSLALNSLGKVA